MSEVKTSRTGASVSDFLDRAAAGETRRDCATLVRLMRRITGSAPAMWGPSIVGFGSYRYVYESGRTGEWPLTGFSPRKGNLVLYVMAGFQRYPELMRKLGRYRTGKSCLYVRSLADVDPDVLEELVAESVAWMRRRYPAVAGTTGSRPAAKKAAGKATRKKAVGKATKTKAKTRAKTKAAPAVRRAKR